jgi:hypothetical protein
MLLFAMDRSDALHVLNEVSGVEDCDCDSLEDYDCDSLEDYDNRGTSETCDQKEQRN